jgi:hypothetical protein
LNLAILTSISDSMAFINQEKANGISRDPLHATVLKGLDGEGHDATEANTVPVALPDAVLMALLPVAGDTRKVLELGGVLAHELDAVTDDPDPAGAVLQPPLGDLGHHARLASARGQDDQPAALDLVDPLDEPGDGFFLVGSQSQRHLP